MHARSTMEHIMLDTREMHAVMHGVTQEARHTIEAAHARHNLGAAAYEAANYEASRLLEVPIRNDGPTYVDAPLSAPPMMPNTTSEMHQPMQAVCDAERRLQEAEVRMQHIHQLYTNLDMNTQQDVQRELGKLGSSHLAASYSVPAPNGLSPPRSMSPVRPPMEHGRSPLIDALGRSPLRDLLQYRNPSSFSEGIVPPRVYAPPRFPI